MNRTVLTAAGVIVISNDYWITTPVPRGLRRRSAAARLLRLWVRVPPGQGCLLLVLCVVRCDELIIVQRSLTDCGASLCVI